MNIENINDDLDAATGHLRTTQEATTASESMVHTIWETVGGLATKPSFLYLLQPSEPSLTGTKREVTPQDITTTVDTAATGYSEARAELSAGMSGSSDDHINNARTHLDNAVELLRERDMDATTQAKIIEANVERLGEGVGKIVSLLFEMNDVAYRLESSVWSNARHTQNSIDSIEAYQQGL
jgi:hypothetical protein